LHELLIAFIARKYIFSLWDLLCISNSSFVSNKFSQSSMGHLKHFTKFELRLFLFKKHLKIFLLFFSGFSKSPPDVDDVSFWGCSDSNKISFVFFSWNIFEFFGEGIGSSSWDIIKE